MNRLQEKGLYDGLKAGFPIVIGYLPIGMAFGLLARNVGVPFGENCLFSILVFAGASQFMALDLLRAGIATGDIVLATFLLNLRHMVMSASLAARLNNINKKWLPIIAFGITDETFSVASLQEGKLTSAFLLALNGISHGAWIGGTATGYVVGTILPETVQISLGVGLYAMFTAILTPEIKKSMAALTLAALSGFTYIALDALKFFPDGWKLITAIIIGSTAGPFLLKDSCEGDKI